MVKSVREEISNDAKNARIAQWALTLNMDPERTSAVLTDKYGPYAYDIMESAMTRPSALMGQVGGDASDSKEAAEYFIKHIVSHENLANAFGTDAQTIAANIAAYQAEHPQAEETPEQIEIRERQERFNQHFNEEMNRRNNEAEVTVDPAQIDISQMTLDDYATYCNPEDRPAANYDDLVEKAYEDFGKGEGIVKGLYLDSLGYPTIGNGHLVLHPDYLRDPNRLAAARNAYIDIPLIGADGRPLSKEQKRLQFTQITLAMKNNSFRTSGGCPNYVLSPATGKLNDDGTKYIFKQDFKYAYNQTKRVVANIDKMPLPVQLATLHCTFAYGNARRLAKADVNNPASVMAQVDKLRNRKGTSFGERATIRLGNDSIQAAQNNYVREQQHMLLNRDVMHNSPETATEQQSAAIRLAVNHYVNSMM